jgi:hypothetical protein
VRRPARLGAAAALAAALAAAGCGRDARETAFLNLDPESSTGALASGWSGFEKTEPGDTFVWAQARDVTVRVFARGPGERLVRFRAWPFLWEGAPPQTVTVSVNDVRLESMTVWPGPRVYAATSPGPAWKEGENTLTFSFGYAEAPKDRVPGAADTRTLAAAFDWIEIVPVVAETPARK